MQAEQLVPEVPQDWDVVAAQDEAIRQYTLLVLQYGMAEVVELRDRLSGMLN